MESPGREKQILVAGVGNALLRDDGFGGAVAKGLERARAALRGDGDGLRHRRPRPRLRGDARLRRPGARRRQQQGGEPGTLYVIEPEESEVEGGIEDGEVINPHGMDPQTVLRFVKSVGGWPGKVVIVACEPTGGRDDGDGAERRRRRARSSARSTSCSSRSPSCSRTRPTEGERCTSSRSPARSSRPRCATPRAAGSSRCRCGSARCARSSPSRSTSTSGSSPAAPTARGRRLEPEYVPARLRCDGCATEWEPETAAVPLPELRRRRGRGPGRS